MTQALLSPAEATQLILRGRPLLLAGDERLLSQLPAGKWIGGTIPYFMTASGGAFSQEGVFVTELPADIVDAAVKVYDQASLPGVYRDIPENGLGFVILPATSPVHLEFAVHAPEYADFAMRPLAGWVSGVSLADLGKIAPKVIDGSTGTIYENAGVVLHVQLPPHQTAEIGIINLFKQGPGDALQFTQAGFSASDVLVNGELRNFAAYVKDHNLDLQRPLVADYAGAQINVSFQGIDEANGCVNLYAPVFPGVIYRQAAPVGDYVTDFNREIASTGSGAVTFSCNCILNYLFSQLEGKQTGHFTGPITFGEVAYQLLNQTMVYVTISSHN